MFVYTKEIMLEKIMERESFFAEGYEVRLIVFEVEKGPDVDCRSIVDIIVCTVDAVPSWIRTIEDQYFDEISLHRNHDDVNFGRARKLASRALKVAQELTK